ncbi:MAG TPA: hypothetical protein VGD45_33955 [Steroidobacter sp.]|uniref:hypothetical protein n=1 Tax=Steroidobacter sp. TaxID=1978227 RepID=UPI002ED7C87F
MSFDESLSWGTPQKLPLIRPSAPKGQIAEAIAGNTAGKVDALHDTVKALRATTDEINKRTLTNEQVLASIHELLKTGSVEQKFGQIQSALADISGRLVGICKAPSPPAPDKESAVDAPTPGT